MSKNPVPPLRLPIVVTLAVCVLSFVTVPGFTQTRSGTLRGQVTDPSGAAVTNASVILTPSDGKPVSGKTKNDGSYEFLDLAPGKYTVQVNAKGFAQFLNEAVDVSPGQTQSLKSRSRMSQSPIRTLRSM